MAWMWLSVLDLDLALAVAVVTWSRHLVWTEPILDGTRKGGGGVKKWIPSNTALQQIQARPERGSRAVIRITRRNLVDPVRLSGWRPLPIACAPNNGCHVEWDLDFAGTVQQRSPSAQCCNGDSGCSKEPGA